MSLPELGNQTHHVHVLERIIFSDRVRHNCAGIPAHSKDGLFLDAIICKEVHFLAALRTYHYEMSSEEDRI